MCSISFGRCAQLSGLLNDAVQAWREVAEHRQHDCDKQSGRDSSPTGDRLRVTGGLGSGLAARQAAAEAFPASAQPEEAATERLAAAAHLRSAGRFRASLALLAIAREDVEPSQRWDLKARIMGRRGQCARQIGRV